MSRITRFSLMALLAASVLSAPAARAGEKAASGSAKSSATASSSAYKPAETSGSHKQTTKSTHKIDLNTASKEELLKLPGIDEATADKIIAARPLKSKSDLVDKKLMTQSEYSKLSSHVMVAKPTKEAASK